MSTTGSSSNHQSSGTSTGSSAGTGNTGTTAGTESSLGVEDTAALCQDLHGTEDVNVSTTIDPYFYFQEMEVSCPLCNHDCALRMRFTYNGLNKFNPEEQEIKYRFSFGPEIGGSMKDLPYPAGHSAPGPSGQLCPANPPYEFHGNFYQSFDRMKAQCPYCLGAVQIKVKLAYLGVDCNDPDAHEFKLRISVDKDFIQRLPLSPNQACGTCVRPQPEPTAQCGPGRRMTN